MLSGRFPPRSRRGVVVVELAAALVPAILIIFFWESLPIWLRVLLPAIPAVLWAAMRLSAPNAHKDL